MNTFKFTLPTLFFILFLVSSCDKTEPPEWMSVAELEDSRGYHVVYFRKSFMIDEIPDIMNLDISALQRYKLFINGNLIGLGPQISDPDHWKYDSYNLAEYLTEGKNLIAVEVVNFGDFTGHNMFSLPTGLWIRSEDMPVLNSGKGWKALENKDYHPIKIKNSIDVRGGFLAPSCDSVIISEEIRDWFARNYDDFSWEDTEVMDNQNIKLSHRSIPLLERRKERFKVIRSGTGEAKNFSFTDTSFSLRVDANSKLSLLIDNGVLTTGFPELLFSGGKDAEIKISYAESLYRPGQRDAEGNIIGEGLRKGNRNITKGKKFIGYYDFIRSDGSRAEIFRPSWFRTYRYLQLEITTSDSPLTIDDFYGVFTAYPFEQKAWFECSDSTLNKIWETSWRTARLCAWETYMDCPYYEQLQYVGDTRIQALISMYNTGDLQLMKNAIEQFAWSIDSTGLTLACYPASSSGIIPPFSLFWTMMIADFYDYTGDLDFVSGFIEKVKGVFSWHLNYLDEEKAVLKDLDHWNFVDWPDEWAWDPAINTGGMPEGVSEGGISSILNLQFVYALQKFDPVLRSSGENNAANQFHEISDSIRDNIFKLCWDPERGMLKDAYEGQDFSQHANLLAVLTGLIPEKDAPDFIQKIAFDPELIQTTIYYRFYLFEALRTAGSEELYFGLLDNWKQMLDLGLTTFAERNDPTRSDCHAWSANPAYHFLTLICGVRPSEPGFARVLVEPHPGHLDRIDAGISHPEGIIEFSFKRTERDSFYIHLPQQVKGTFRYKNLEEELEPGPNYFTSDI